MAHGTRAAVNARIVYWGPEQAGVSTILRRLYARLRPDHRGDLREVPTRIDPATCYEVLPIKLGEVGGVDTRIEIVAVPGAPEHAPTRKQLLDRADGLVFVADARPERIDATVERFTELRRALADYGRSMETIPLVIQINRRDLAAGAALEALTRRLGAVSAPRFETVASEGAGVLHVLSTISKAVVRSLREPAGSLEQPASPAPQPPAAAAPAVRVPGAAAIAGEWPEPIRSRRTATGAGTAAPPPKPDVPASFEEVTGRIDPPPAEALTAAPGLVQPEPDGAPPKEPFSLRIVSVGAATCDDGRTIRLPVEAEAADGGCIRLVLTLGIDLSAPSTDS